MKLYFATTNRRKIASLVARLKDYDVDVLPVPMNIPEARSDSVEAIAKDKVGFAYRIMGSPTVALDAGFFIHALNGFPRAFVNFALDTIKLEGILKLMEGKDPRCEFRECMAYMDQSLQEPLTFTAHIPGRISPRIRGQDHKYLWSSLGLIFIPEGHEKTLGEMGEEDYIAWRDDQRKDSATGRFVEWYSTRLDK